MDEPLGRRLPWGQILTLALLSLLLTAVFREAPWRVVLASVAIAGAAFLTLRQVQNYFWGVAAALVLALHPLHWEWSQESFERALRADAMELIVLAAVVTGCRLATLPNFTPWSWLLTAVALSGGAALAWPALPQAGLVSALLTATGLLGGALLAVARHRQRPAWGNVALAALLGLAAPAVGLLLAPISTRLLDLPISPVLERDCAHLDFLAAVNRDAAGLEIRGIALENLHRWAWPTVWVVLPLMVWGFWSSLLRGRRDLLGKRPPLAWVLSLYTVADLTGAALHSREALQTVFLPLASLAGLLSIYGVAEFFRRLMRPLRLPTPEERQREEIEGS